MINLETKTAYHVFDEFGMLCIPSDQSWESRSWWKKLWDKILKREWTPTWSNKSWRDSLGRTVLAWIAYGMPVKLEHSIDGCFEEHNTEDKYKLYRHPNHKESVSRDHWSYFIIQSYLSLYSNQWTIDSINDKMFPRMRGLNSWMKALTGSKLASWWYYTLAIPGAYIGNWWLRKCRKWGGVKPERDNNWWIEHEQIELPGADGKIYYPYLPDNNGTLLQWHRTIWQKLWAWIIFTSMPAYALHNKAWQIFVMRESRRKSFLKRILLKRVGKSNLMLRLLLGGSVTQEEIDSYPNMTGYRPGVYLDETCRRDIGELTDKEAEFNTYEKDLIIWLYEKT